MTEEGIEQLYEEFHTPLHVRRHCMQVGLVGELLAKALREAGKEVDVDLVRQGGLVHDFVRVVDFKELDEALGTPEDRAVWAMLRARYMGRHHADVGADILRERNEHALADVVARHATGKILTQGGPNSWESKLVFYADKRVTHDRIVPLKERIAEGWKRHFGGRPKTREEQEIDRAIHQLEKEIFAPLKITPDDVERLINGPAADPRSTH